MCLLKLRAAYGLGEQTKEDDARSSVILSTKKLTTFGHINVQLITTQWEEKEKCKNKEEKHVCRPSLEALSQFFERRIFKTWMVGWTNDSLF